VLAWQADSLLPVAVTGSAAPTGALTNRDATAPDGSFLSSVWMSGAGLAGDGEGVYFATGNSDPSGTTYDGVNNIQESVVKLAFSTTAILDLFTPSGWAQLDQNDQDFGSGGVMLLPSVDPARPRFATAAGKKGILYLIDRHAMGGYTPGGPDKVLAQVNIGTCLCAESYFAAPTPTVVSSGGNQIMLWQVRTEPTVGLTLLATSPVLSASVGFFTTVSSNAGTSPIIWAVLRPTWSNADRTVRLYAFGATPTPGTSVLPQLFVSAVGQWPAPQSNGNIVPVVANGRVYVAANNQLAILGLPPVAP
jgi:hypothetical protein